jgi:xanthine dehydrogenase accessory factor
MRELDAIILKYELLKEQKVDCVLATVVHVDGSSYRRPGARMLVDEYGNITGAISGGCLEGDALRKALHAMHQQKNKLVTYDTSDEDDAIIGAQLGCNGIIQVLFEPLDYEDELNPCELLKEVINQKHPLAIVIQFDLDKSKEQAGTKLVISANSEVIGSKPNQDLYDLIVKQAHLSLQNRTSHFAEVIFENETQYFFHSELSSSGKIDHYWSRE